MNKFAFLLNSNKSNNLAADETCTGTITSTCGDFSAISIEIDNAVRMILGDQNIFPLRLLSKIGRLKFFWRDPRVGLAA